MGQALSQLGATKIVRLRGDLGTGGSLEED
jgi:hypothetical protein